MCDAGRQDWFQGMNAAFLSCGLSLEEEGAVRTTRRLLLLNSLDSLGKELTVAQMQGKIQVEPLPGRGHHLHEEEPHKVGELLLALC
jgi:protein phosphatase methylesterase 1